MLMRRTPRLRAEGLKIVARVLPTVSIYPSPVPFDANAASLKPSSPLLLLCSTFSPSPHLPLSFYSSLSPFSLFPVSHGLFILCSNHSTLQFLRHCTFKARALIYPAGRAAERSSSKCQTSYSPIHIGKNQANCLSFLGYLRYKYFPVLRPKCPLQPYTPHPRNAIIPSLSSPNGFTSKPSTTAL